VQEICRREYPPFVQINENHQSLCHFAREVYAESLKENENKAAAEVELQMKVEE
jgi:hypothetical protein